jgi:hypothetical protein
LEPGETYAFSTQSDLEHLAKLIVQNDKIRDHVGFNFDVGHYKIVGIEAQDLRRTVPQTEKGDVPSGIQYKDLIVHAHIADHPSDHTCDMPLGFWTPITRRMTKVDYGFTSYLEMLRDAASDRSPGGLPISGVVALELEGCSRMDWVNESIANLKHLIEGGP